jgi:hypothetical protein
MATMFDNEQPRKVLSQTHHLQASGSRKQASWQVLMSPITPGARLPLGLLQLRTFVDRYMGKATGARPGSGGPVQVELGV